MRSPVYVVVVDDSTNVVATIGEVIVAVVLTMALLLI